MQLGRAVSNTDRFWNIFCCRKKGRKGRNPQTGKEIKIAAKKVPRFSAGAALKAAATGRQPLQSLKQKKHLPRRQQKQKRNKPGQQAGRSARLIFLRNS
jgi:hypothetical protein